MQTRIQDVNKVAKRLDSRLAMQKGFDKKPFNSQFKLKPISFVVLTMLAQAAWQQQAQAEEFAIKRAQAAKTAQLPKPILLAENTLKNTPDVYDVLLGDEPALSMPTTAQRYNVSKEIIHTAETSNSKVSEPANPDNKINTPNKSLDSKTLNKKEGANLPLGTESKDPKASNIQLQEVKVRAKKFHEIGPLPGLGLTKEQIPGNVQSITAKEIKDTHSLSLTDLLNRKLQSVNVNDYQGNPFQMDVTYRGFTAGPQIGTPQGLSVFFDGIRVNEPFGDVVNWDMIPMNAIAGVDVFPGSNPIFGLNTLGGAFTLKTKDGFNHEGVDAEVLAGSFGRKQLQVEGGWNNGDFALFGAGNFFLEDGWRDNSPSKVNQFFGKASYRGDKLDLNLSTLLVANNLVGNGLLPSEEYARDPTSVFTSPDTTKNKLAQFQLSGSFFVNDNFTITGQMYRRDSKRKQKGADVFRGFEETLIRRRPGIDPLTGRPEQFTCLFAESPTTPGIPEYYVLPINQTAGDNLFVPGSLAGDFYNDYVANGFVTSAYDAYLNTPLPNDFATAYRQVHDYYRNPRESLFFNRGTPEPTTFGPPISNALGDTADSFVIDVSFFQVGTFNGLSPADNIVNIALSTPTYFNTFAANGDLIQNIIIPKTPTNLADCNAARFAGDPQNGNPALAYFEANPDGGSFVDGADDGYDPITGEGTSGLVEGVPTALISNNQIDQITDGASVQFNWNFDQHKFMVGASIDAANAEYKNSQQLGFLDANRNAYLDPAQARPMFIGAFRSIENNNFEGTQTTKSIYFSETWTPVDTWNFSASGRFNHTNVKNIIATRYGRAAYQIGDLTNRPDYYETCNGDCSVNPPPTNYREPRIFNTLDPAETEKFTYRSFNPSLGATWQAKENLNIFANWAKGTRVPSVIELGCAFDDTPTVNSGGTTGPRSVVENRFCSLPTTLSGDPFLPQIRATTYDIGMRGNLAGLLGTDGLEWNLGAYQTDLKDDIYFVAFQDGTGFFDSIGKTRRRGLEAGLSGKKGKWGFGVNYGLTDATFENNFIMVSEDNSSSFFLDGVGNVIQVKQGSRMPGVPLHNLNANVSYEVTPQWQVGFSTIVHSESYVRGNENNEHKVGVQMIGRGSIGVGRDALRQPTNNPGKVPGYATFNFQTSYKFNSEWTATMQVNNVFDKEFFSAGRLGRNPFSPSIDGAIGPSGYNHNSNDWLSTNFIAPGAPRGIWFSLNWQFDPKK